MWRIVDVVNRQVHKLFHARPFRPFERGEPFLRLRHRHGVQQEQAVDAFECWAERLRFREIAGFHFDVGAKQPGLCGVAGQDADSIAAPEQHLNHRAADRAGGTENEHFHRSSQGPQRSLT
ncbi:MAG TPA: hypothetical protein VIS96_17300 [Terrimicrobiaceae bacterium]